MISETHNIDCIELMRGYPDNYFDLAVVDPPYGIKRFENGIGKNDRHKVKSTSIFNNNPPNEIYFNELFRVSKNQIIWGANNFTLPPTEYFCIWNKKQSVDNFASAEYAWVSMGLKQPALVFEYSIHKHNQTDKIHPTQKPIALYDWIFEKYAKKGDKILDTHLGSQSSRIAAYKAGLDFVGAELDKEYFDQGNKRFEDFKIVFEQEVGKEKILNGQARLF
jgi:site-specific DNA-methyltransferase (adenine-specific)